MMRAEALKNGAIQLLLALNALVMLFPIALMVLSAFKSNAEIFDSPFTLPDTLDFSNLLHVWNDTEFVQYLLNSLVITT